MAVIDPASGNHLEYRHLIKGAEGARWIQANINEIGRLTDARVGNNVTGSNTLFFIAPDELPSDKKATYLRPVADYRPQKEDPYRVRWTVGGNKIDYPGDVSTPTADLTTTKLLWNSVISTPGARYMCIDIKDYYLNNAMDAPEFMWVPVAMLPQQVMDAYHLAPLVRNNMVLVRIEKGMYGLPQAGRIAQDRLI